MSAVSTSRPISHHLLAHTGLALLLAGAGTAQDFDRSVVVRNLAQPTGITVAPSGEVYLTEVPQPGVMGGNNRVVRLENDGSLTQISIGEPEPVNLAADAGGNLYWTCRSAGVILRRDPQGNIAPLLRGLDQPTGIATAPAGGDVWITQIPTPGVPGRLGGTNTVDVVDPANPAVSLRSMGQPEPVDVAVDAAGNAWWNCRTAGVILGYDAATGTVSRLLAGLANPTGIAVDGLGNLYFTEVPTPGVMAGDNRVWKYDLDRSVLTLISQGEPEPVDVAVSQDGQRVYWTCRTAGVVVMGSPAMPRPTIEAPRSATPGDSIIYSLRMPAAADQMYFAVSSLQVGSVDLGMGSRFPLGLDPLFEATLAQMRTGLVSGYLGQLDRNGNAVALLAIPSEPSLAGLQVLTGWGILDATGPLGVGRFSDAHVVRID